MAPLRRGAFPRRFVNLRRTFPRRVRGVSLFLVQSPEKRVQSIKTNARL